MCVTIKLKIITPSKVTHLTLINGLTDDVTKVIKFFKTQRKINQPLKKMWEPMLMTGQEQANVFSR